MGGPGGGGTGGPGGGGRAAARPPGGDGRRRRPREAMRAIFEPAEELADRADATEIAVEEKFGRDATTSTPTARSTRPTTAPPRSRPPGRRASSSSRRSGRAGAASLETWELVPDGSRIIVNVKMEGGFGPERRAQAHLRPRGGGPQRGEARGHSRSPRRSVACAGSPPTTGARPAYRGSPRGPGPATASPGSRSSCGRTGRRCSRAATAFATCVRGPRIDPATAFRLASVTKQFTAMAVMLLVRDGKLRYEDALTDVVPGLPGLRPGDHDPPPADPHLRPARTTRT